MQRLLILLHLLGLVLGLGGLVCHLMVLARYQQAPGQRERALSEEIAHAVLEPVQRAGVLLSLATGIALLWSLDWAPLQQGWVHFKLLFVFWILAATRLMRRNLRNMLQLRKQSKGEESDRLRSLKDNHRMIGIVTLCTFLFVVIFSLWQPLD